MPQIFRGIGSETGGVVLILLGVAGFFMELRDVANLLTLVVIYYGVRDLVAPYQRPPSIMVLVVGAWLALNAYEIFMLGFTKPESWPLLIVLIGIAFIYDGLVDDGADEPQVQGD